MTSRRATSRRSLKKIRNSLRQFSAERNWDQFHLPKNLVMALIVEAGELLEHFLWISDKDSVRLDRRKMAQVGDEMADVFIYLIRLSDKLGIDLLEVTEKKLKKNKRKYPARKVFGSSKKYTEY